MSALPYLDKKIKALKDKSTDEITGAHERRHPAALANYPPDIF